MQESQHTESSEASNLPAQNTMYVSKEMALEPAINKFQEKYYSLQPDMANGWRPNRRMYRRIPIRHNYYPVDLLVKEYTALGNPKEFRVLYLGNRPPTNFKAVHEYCWKEFEPAVRECFLYGVQRFDRFQFRYYKDQQKLPISQLAQPRIFTGMNPTVDSDELIFDSDFECGNLDLVMKVGPNEYDLFMRVDSNTKGHTSWYFFKIRKTRADHVVKLNICNFHKKNSLYCAGMKPMVFSKASGKGWKHGGENVIYQKKLLRYDVAKNLKRQMSCLSFQYKFEADYDQVYFAYAIPYSYSYLMHSIKELTQNPYSRHFTKVSYNLQSCCGLSIPLITINENEQKGKKVVLITSRLHPGQTQGSWMMHGVLKYLCSEKAAEIRSQMIFKVLPMVNVDGVVLGNFRTGLLGLDLNRLFMEDESEDFYEVEHVHEIAASGQKPLVYVDLHGHSTKKNVFIYGPDYKLSDTQYILCRLLPKQISKLTEMFRYYSCIFKISKGKQKTARAVLLRQHGIPFCYTVEASAQGYVSAEGEVDFTCELYQQMGSQIANSFTMVLPILIKIQTRRQQIREMILKNKEVRQGKTHMYHLPKVQTKGRSLSNKKTVWDVLKPSDNNIKSQICDDFGEQIHTNLMDEIAKQDPSLFQVHTEGQSDCEDAHDDYTREELFSFLHKQKINKDKSSKGRPSNNASPFIKPRTIPKNNLSLNPHKMQQGESIFSSVQLSSEAHQRRVSKGNNSLQKTRLSRFDASPETNAVQEVVGKKELPILRKRAESIRQAVPRKNSQMPEAEPYYLSKIYKLNLDAPDKTPVKQRLNMQTIESRKSQADGLDQYSTNKLIPRQSNIINLTPLQFLQGAQFQYTKPIPNRKYIELNSRKDLLARKRKLQVVNSEASLLPSDLGEILRRHINAIAEDPNNLHKSIRIVKL